MRFVANALLTLVTTLPVVWAGEMLAVADSTDVIPDSYIVVMNEGITDNDFQSHRTWATGMNQKANRKRGVGYKGVVRTFNATALKGYSGSFDRQTIRQIANNSDVRPLRYIPVESLFS